MVIEFRRKEAIFYTFLLPSKLSSSSCMIPLLFFRFLLQEQLSYQKLIQRMTYERWKEGFEKSTVRAIWLWRRKTHYIESGKANLRAKDTCKLGYSCLSTNRCLSSKCHSKHRLPLKQMGNYKGGRAGRPHRGKNTAGVVFLPIQHFATLIKKKKKEYPTALHF